MRVLAVDTATFMGTVAVTEAGRLLAETSASVRAAHGETLMPHLQRTLEQARLRLADIDLLAVGLGPGSFTGVRIGVATLKGLALSEDKPLVGLDSLQVMAAGMLGAHALRVPVVDAYKGEVYLAVHALGGPRPLPEECLAPVNLPPDAAVERVLSWTAGRPALTAGDGLIRYPELLRALSVAGIERAPALCDAPRAAVLAELAAHHYAAHGTPDLALLEPRYVRPSDARLPARPLRSHS